jgi:hypothetical protein
MIQILKHLTKGISKEKSLWDCPSGSGLPDGLFSNQKFQFGQIFEGLRLEKMDLFYAIWNILRTFGIF